MIAILSMAVAFSQFGRILIMRVTTGTARGMNLMAPPSSDVTRPTSDMTKQAMFNIVQFELEGAEVLDLFAGSGQLGIEALSRGAKQATFVDSSRDAQDVIMENLKHTKLLSQAKLIATDYVTFLSRGANQFDIAFMDPPYNQKLIDAALPLVARRMRRNGVILCESEKSEVLPDSAEDFVKVKEYRYGRAKLTVYRCPQEDEE